MFHLDGYEQAIRNLYRVCYTVGRSQDIVNVEQLRQCYLDFLGKQKTAIDSSIETSPFIVDADEEVRLSAFFSGIDHGDRRQRRVMGPPYSPDVHQAKIAHAQSALSELLSCDEDLRTIFELVIHSIIVRPHGGTGRCHGGSNSSAIGLIWLSVDSALNERDLCEIFIHELTHHLLYIDELNNPHFIYGEMFAEENFVPSAILEEPRSVGKVVHSILVAIEIVLARQRFGWGHGSTTVHPDSIQLLAGVRRSYDSMTALPRFEGLTTGHVREILVRAMGQCQVLEDTLSGATTSRWGIAPGRR